MSDHLSSPYGPQPERVPSVRQQARAGDDQHVVPLSALQALMYSRASSLSPRNAIRTRLANGTCRSQIRTDLTVCGTASIPCVAITFPGSCRCSRTRSPGKGDEDARRREERGLVSEVHAPEVAEEADLHGLLLPHSDRLARREPSGRNVTAGRPTIHRRWMRAGLPLLGAAVHRRVAHRSLRVREARRGLRRDGRHAIRRPEREPL